MAYESVTNNQKISFGRQALLAYQNQMVARFGSDYKLSFEGLLQIVTEKEPEFLLRLGDSVARAGLGQRRLDEAMERVAENSTPTAIPGSFTFSQGVTDELSSFDFSLLGDAALEVAQDALEKGKEVGQALGTGLSDATKGIGSTLSFLGNNLKWIVMLIVGLLLIIGFGWLKKRT